MTALIVMRVCVTSVCVYSKPHNIAMAINLVEEEDLLLVQEEEASSLC